MWILPALQERAFSVPGSNPRSYIVFSCHISLVSFSLWHFPFFPGLSRPYHLRRVLIRWFVECTPIWEHFIFWLLDWGFSFLSEYHRSGMPLSEHNVSQYIMSICLISGDINLDYLVEVVSSAFLPCNATSFTNVINEIPGENNLRLCKYTLSPQFFPSNIETDFSTYLWILPATIPTIAF